MIYYQQIYSRKYGYLSPSGLGTRELHSGNSRVITKPFSLYIYTNFKASL